MPARPDHVDHSGFFDPADFADVQGDTQALAHRVTPDAVVAFTVPVPAPTGPSYGVVTA